MKSFGLVSLVALLLVGCPPVMDPVVCTEIFVLGLNVTITDGHGDPVAGATLTLVEGDCTETMIEIDAMGQTGVYVGAGERAGTYSLTIEAEGFDTITLDDIAIDADECHVIPVGLTLSLTAL